MTPMTTRLRSVNPLQLGLVFGLVYAVLAFVFALLYALFGAAILSHTGVLGMMPAMGFGLVIVAPIMYFVIGFIVFVIVGALYNLVAGWIGGIEVTFETAPVESPVV
jgi:Na+-transporting NADH:ubiquinone oxidoreductase subunit NqrD